MSLFGPTPAELRRIAAEAKRRGRTIVVVKNHAGDVGLCLVEDLEEGRGTVLWIPLRSAEQVIVDMLEALK